MKKILFICKYNRFRSRLAERYFNKLNKNKKIKARSAGIIRGNPIDKIQAAVSKEEGIDISGKPTGVTSKMLGWQDTIIIVANDVPPALFDPKKYRKKMIIWKIPDTTTNRKTDIRRIIKSIKIKVEELVKKVEAKNEI